MQASSIRTTENQKEETSTMSKRGRDDSKGNNRKRYKVVQTTLDPNTSGIYVTCTRSKERSAASELMALLEDKAEEYYGEELKALQEDALEGDEGKEESTNDQANKDESFEKEELSIEEQVQKELQELKDNKTQFYDAKKKKPVLQQIDLQTECLVFIKTRKPIAPEEFVHNIIKDMANPDDLHKRTRFVQKFTPVTDSCHASMEELGKLCDRVLPKHFHQEGTESLKFAVEINKRNFNTMDKMEMIKFIAGYVGKQGSLDHKVDLKNYDKLVLLQCFKNNIGMCVVDKDYRIDYKKYNIQELFQQKLKNKEMKKLQTEDAEHKP